MATAKPQALYDVHPGVAMVRKWVAELRSKTGRSLEEWLELVKKEGPKDELVAARMAQNEAQAGHQQRMVDCGARRWQGRRRFGGSVFEERGEIRGRAIRRRKGKAASDL